MKKYLYLIILLIMPALSMADYDFFNHLPQHIKPLTLLSINEPQNVFHFVNKKQANRPLLSQTQQRQALANFKQQFFSPWATRYLDAKSRNSATNKYLRTLEKNQISYYKKHPGWGENNHQHTHAWIKELTDNIDIKNFPNIDRPAITVDNAYVRAMPTLIPDFNHYGLVGEGYPFDNFQTSVVWADTPIYVVQSSKDGAWALVITPSVTGWIQTQDFAYVNADFIKQWKNANFAATIVNHFTIKDTANIFRFQAYLGSIFPIVKTLHASYEIAIPVKDLDNHAVIRKASVSAKYIQAMPYKPTQAHVANLINEILGSPYGWGGLYFYNDCSSSLKNIFATFGIWLPRNSKAQLKAAPSISLEKLWPNERAAYILKHGTPFMTLIYVTGHIMLYIGEKNGQVMTFQDVWALVSVDAHNHQGRAVIGKAVLMPLKLRYGNTGLFPQIDGDNLSLVFLSKI